MNVRKEQNEGDQIPVGWVRVAVSDSNDKTIWFHVQPRTSCTTCYGRGRVVRYVPQEVREPFGPSGPRTVTVPTPRDLPCDCVERRLRVHVANEGRVSWLRKIP